MRRTLLTACLFGSFALLIGIAEAEPQPDSQGAKTTREKLKKKITVTCDNIMLRDIITELQGALKDAGGGTLRIKPLPNEGITLTSRFTIKAKDETLEDVLDKLLKEKNWGYIVNIGKPGDQDDGAVMLVTKPLRGYPEEAKGKTDTKTVAKKEDTKKEEPKTKETSTSDKDEKAAAGRLGLAEAYLEMKKPEKAKPILEDIVKKYPTSKTAEKAKSLLEKIEK